MQRTSGVDAAALQRAGVPMEELCDERGLIDPDRVDRALDGVRRSLGLDPVGVRRGVGGGGLTGSDYGIAGAPDLVQALTPKRR